MKQSSVMLIASLFVALLVLLLLIVWLRRQRREGFEAGSKVTFFRMNGCGWCEKFKPEWEKFVDMAKEKGIKTEEVEASQDPDRIAAEKIKGFPTILLETNGIKKEYDGDRTASAIMKALSSPK